MSEYSLDVAFSNQNILDPHPRQNLANLRRYTPDRVGWFAQAAGYNSVQWMPFFDMAPGHGLRAVAKAVTTGDLVIGSWHQAWRHTPWSRRRDKIPGETLQRGPLAARLAINSPVIGRLVFGPTMMDSAKVIGKAQKKLGQPRDTIFYPHRNKQLDLKQIQTAGGAGALIQPQDREARKVGAKSLDHFDREIREERGYDGYAFDTGWARHEFDEEWPTLISNVKTSVPKLAPYVQEVHLALGRPDQGLGARGEGELENAIAGIYQDEIGDMLDEIKRAGQVRRVVVESPFSSVANVTGMPSENDLVEAYAAIAAGVRAYWQAEPEPSPSA